LLDEPFAALDDLLRQQLNEELPKLWQLQRWTAVFVTHNVSEAVFLSPRVLVMSPRPGTIAAEVDIDLPHPRPANIRTTPAFTAHVECVTQALRLEKPR
jgi:NitT/TauT family transport system ATP-binding protein